MGQGASVNPPTLPEAERALDNVLSRPEFSREPTLLSRILERIGDLLGRVLSLLLNGNGGLSIWGWIAATALLSVLAYFLVRLLGRRGGRNGRKQDSRMARKVAEKPLTPIELLARADVLAASGELTQALGYLMAALLTRLQADGVLKTQPGRTNRQHMADLRRAGRPETGFFEAFCRDFNRFRYGGMSASLSDYDNWREPCVSIILVPERRAG